MILWKSDAEKVPEPEKNTR